MNIKIRKPSNNLGMLFDFNGVVIDDFSIQKQSWDSVIVNIRGTPLSNEEMIRLRGLPSKEFFRHATQKVFTASEIESILQEKGKIIQEHFSKLSADQLLFKGIKHFFNQIKEQRIPMTIATSATPKMMEFYFNHLKLSRWFSMNTIVCNDETYPGKPDPEVFLRAARNIKIPPQHCVVFEDAIVGIEAAHRAGVKRIVAIGSEKQLKILETLHFATDFIHDFSNVQLSDYF